ncbi:CbtB domain-containing protein [Azospirillum sp. B2RO_4]|uniref:CbtB domain-containing protein n=1 Tax=Azospirillum sp. B2RO_4 TaxID=3027796 RepID=UPI003DA85CCA
MTTRSINTVAAGSATRSAATYSAAQAAVAAFAAILLGSFLLYGVGFAQPQQIHDAAHDARHSFAFPCH